MLERKTRCDRRVTSPGKSFSGEPFTPFCFQECGGRWGEIYVTFEMRHRAAPTTHSQTPRLGGGFEIPASSTMELWLKPERINEDLRGITANLAIHFQVLLREWLQTIRLSQRESYIYWAFGKASLWGIDISAVIVNSKCFQVCIWVFCRWSIYIVYGKTTSH